VSAGQMQMFVGPLGLTGAELAGGVGGQLPRATPIVPTPPRTGGCRHRRNRPSPRVRPSSRASTLIPAASRVA